jgi:hypothetical protein
LIVCFTAAHRGYGRVGDKVASLYPLIRIANDVSIVASCRVNIKTGPDSPPLQLNALVVLASVKESRRSLRWDPYSRATIISGFWLDEYLVRDVRVFHVEQLSMRTIEDVPRGTVAHSLYLLCCRKSRLVLPLLARIVSRKVFLLWRKFSPSQIKKVELEKQQAL